MTDTAPVMSLDEITTDDLIGMWERSHEEALPEFWVANTERAAQELVKMIGAEDAMLACRISYEDPNAPKRVRNPHTQNGEGSLWVGCVRGIAKGVWLGYDPQGRELEREHDARYEKFIATNGSGDSEDLWRLSTIALREGFERRWVTAKWQLAGLDLPEARIAAALTK